MSLNKRMHPRNPFKDKKPDFKSLAVKYEEFRKHAITDLKGRVHIDFKKPECLRALSWAILKEEFQLDVDMPMDRLIPTIPLRLNYILWIEDLIGNSDSKIRGIDIGTGASCVYALLGAKKNGWTFLATENDDLNINFAKRNVEKNNLQSVITVVKSAPREILLEPIQSSGNPDQKYDFCMCNPPFFGSNLEAWAMTNTRSEERPEPKSISTASPGECIFPGGEVEFVRTMISDSHQLKDQVRVYSAMLGKKSSLTILKEDLRRTGVSVYGVTEFCQGRTMRWGLAWSFDPDLKFPKAPSKINKPMKPVVYTVPTDCKVALDNSYDVNSVASAVLGCLQELKIISEQKTNFSNKKCWTIKAVENTWSYQRRKRRQKDRQNTEDVSQIGSSPKKIKLDEEQTIGDEQKLGESLDKNIKAIACHTASRNESNVGIKELIEETSEESVSVCDEKSSDLVCSNGTIPEKSISDSENLNSIDNSKSIHGACSEAIISNDSPTHKSLQNNSADGDSNNGTEINEDDDFVLKSKLTISKEGDDVQIQMEWIDGIYVESMHQVLQYFKNTIK